MQSKEDITIQPQGAILTDIAIKKEKEAEPEIQVPDALEEEKIAPVFKIGNKVICPLMTAGGLNDKEEKVEGTILETRTIASQ